MGVPDFLSEQRVAFEMVYHAPAFTAQRRAHYLHLPGRQVAKAVLLSGPQGYVVAVLPATCQVDTAVLVRHLGGPVRLATEAEIADLFLDCEWGVVPPFGTRYGLLTILDEEIAPEDWLVFEASSRVVALRMRCRDFEQLEQPRRLRFARLAPRAAPPHDR